MIIFIYRYQALYFLVVKVDSTGMTRQINMYEISSDTSKQFQLAHVLILNVEDNVSLHTIDNLIIVHHRVSAKSYIFDIRVADSSTTDHLPIIITPIDIAADLSMSYNNLTTFDNYQWFIFTPNVFVDTKLGIFADLQL